MGLLIVDYRGGVLGWHPLCSSFCMPTYDYSCPKCGTFEVYQSIKDGPFKACPTCASKKITKLISSGSGVIFSGSGFWETDYNRSKDYASKKKSESATPAKSDSVTKPATTEAKPSATTPAAKPTKPSTPPAAK